MMNGIIALDMDGTTIEHNHPISKNVAAYLKQLHSMDWEIAFITGRPFRWAYSAIETLDFPYYFAVQNGADILRMPSREVLYKNHIPKKSLLRLQEMSSKGKLGMVLCGGFEDCDRCYYLKDNFSIEKLEYLFQRQTLTEEIWTPYENLNDFEREEFPSVKFFIGQNESLDFIKEIEANLNLNAPIVLDPLNPHYYLIQITNDQVDKGTALAIITSSQKPFPWIIAAGDDNNDRSMLSMANISVVMASAPDEMLKNATIIAPHVSVDGIIQGLREAISLTRSYP